MERYRNRVAHIREMHTTTRIRSISHSPDDKQLAENYDVEAMQPLRAWIGKHRRLALALLALAFCIKAVIPAGFMVSTAGGTVLTVTICSDTLSGIKQMQMVIPGKDQGSGHSETAKKGQHCAFAGLAEAAVGGVDALLLAIAFAVILVLGLAPVRRASFGPNSHLRPPLRGPPVAA